MSHNLQSRGVTRRYGNPESGQHALNTAIEQRPSSRGLQVLSERGRGVVDENKPKDKKCEAREQISGSLKNDLGVCC